MAKNDPKFWKSPMRQDLCGFVVFQNHVEPLTPKIRPAMSLLTSYYEQKVTPCLPNLVLPADPGTKLEVKTC
eukprot:scaffold3208_cov107-Cylindrotheca_fusiformis.AAC.5